MDEGENSWVGWALLIGFGLWIFSVVTDDSPSKTNNYESEARSSYDGENEVDSEDGYSWAEYNDPTTFEECQDQFGTGYEEDECNEYVKENYTGYESFNEYECTEDCSGHEAGYEWAEENGITDEYDCGGNSNSFAEGCASYVEENY